MSLVTKFCPSCSTGLPSPYHSRMAGETVVRYYRCTRCGCTAKTAGTLPTESDPEIVERGTESVPNAQRGVK